MPRKPVSRKKSRSINIWTLRTYAKVKQHARNRVVLDQRSGRKLKRKILGMKYLGKRQGFHTWDVAWVRATPKTKLRRVY